MKNRSCFVAILFLLFGFQANSTVRLSHFFADNMVLQQKTTVRIWGTAVSGNIVKISTTWDKRRYKAKTSREGKWELTLLTPSAGGPYQLSFDDGEKLTLNNILIGEVWLCSGQSNMDMPVQGYKNQPVAGANDILMDADNPSIRLFQVEKKTSGAALTDCNGN